MGILPVRGAVFLVALAIFSFFTGVGEGLLFFWHVMAPAVYGFFFSLNPALVDPFHIRTTIAIVVGIFSIIPALGAIIPAVASTEPDDKKLWADLALMALGTPPILTLAVLSLLPKIAP